jgi:hypothetical protein
MYIRQHPLKKEGACMFAKCPSAFQCLVYVIVVVGTPSNL